VCVYVVPFVTSSESVKGVEAGKRECKAQKHKEGMYWSESNSVEVGELKKQNGFQLGCIYN
jgi:hypothetical protein